MAGTLTTGDLQLGTSRCTLRSAAYLNNEPATRRDASSPDSVKRLKIEPTYRSDCGELMGLFGLLSLS
jgi:hypothetical protein